MTEAERLAVEEDVVVAFGGSKRTMSNYFLNESFTFIAIISTSTSINGSNDSTSDDNWVDSGGGGTATSSSSSSVVNKTTSFAPSLALSTTIPLTTIYLVIFISGVLGNVITCIVISRNKSMHTATNYYLTRYVIV